MVLVVVLKNTFLGACTCCYSPSSSELAVPFWGRGRERHVGVPKNQRVQIWPTRHVNKLNHGVMHISNHKGEGKAFHLTSRGKGLW